MESVVERIPGWSLCYIVNGDATGLSEEDLKMVHDFYENYRKEGMEIQGIYPVKDEAGNSEEYFSRFPAFGLPGEVVDCDVLYLYIPQNKKP